MSHKTADRVRLLTERIARFQQVTPNSDLFREGLALILKEELDKPGSLDLGNGTCITTIPVANPDQPNMVPFELTEEILEEEITEENFEDIQVLVGEEVEQRFGRKKLILPGQDTIPIHTPKVTKSRVEAVLKGAVFLKNEVVPFAHPHTGQGEALVVALSSRQGPADELQVHIAVSDGVIGVDIWDHQKEAPRATLSFVLTDLRTPT